MRSAYRYTITFVDTSTDEVIDTHGSNTVEGVKRTIYRYFKGIYEQRHYDNSGNDVVYIYDKLLQESWIRQLCEEHPDVWIDPDLLYERGIDFDVWHDFCTSSIERAAYDTAKCW